MASALDKVKAFGTKNAGTAAFVGLGMAGEENKVKGLAKALWELTKWKATGTAGLIAGGFLAIRSAIGMAVKESGALGAALDRLNRMKGFERSLSPYVKGLTQARSRMAELLQLAKKSPFGVEELARSSHKLTAYTRGLADSITVLGDLGDIATATNNSLDDTTSAFASLVSALQSGNGIDEAVAAWGEFGTLTTQDADRLRDLARAGMPVAEMLTVVRDGMQKNAGASAEAAHTVEALTQKYEEAKSVMMARFGQSFIAGEKATLETMIQVMTNLAPIAEQVGNALARLIGRGADLAASFAEFATSIPGLGTALAGLVSLFTAATVAATALAAAGIAWFTVVAAVRLEPIIAKIGTWAKALWSGSAATDAAALSQEKLAEATALSAEATAASAAGQDALAVKLYASSAAAYAQGRAMQGVSVAAGLAGKAVGWLRNGLRSLAMTSVYLLAFEALFWAWSKWQEKLAEDKALLELDKQLSQANDAMADQIRLIKTLDDHHKAFADALTAVADAQLALNAAREKGDQKVIKTRENALVDTKKNLEAARQNKGSGMAQSQRDIISKRASEEVALRDAEQDTLMSFASGAQKSKMLKQRIGTEGDKATEGFSAQTNRAAFNENSKDMGAELMSAKKEAEAAQAKAKGTSGTYKKSFMESIGFFGGGREKEDVAMLDKKLANQAAAKAQGKVSDIEEKIQDMKLKSGNRFIAREAQIDAAEKSGQMTVREAQQARIDNETEKKDVEDNAGEHHKKQIDMTIEQKKAAIDSERSSSVSTLQSIAGGGNVGAGTDPHIAAIQKGNSTLNDIKAALDQIIGAPAQEAQRQVKLLD
jgi:hypothetical protein